MANVRTQTLRARSRKPSPCPPPWCSGWSVSPPPPPCPGSPRSGDQTSHQPSSPRRAGASSFSRSRSRGRHRQGHSMVMTCLSDNMVTFSCSRLPPTEQVQAWQCSALTLHHRHGATKPGPLRSGEVQEAVGPVLQGVLHEPHPLNVRAGGGWAQVSVAWIIVTNSIIYMFTCSPEISIIGRADIT